MTRRNSSGVMSVDRANTDKKALLTHTSIGPSRRFDSWAAPSFYGLRVGHVGGHLGRTAAVAEISLAVTSSCSDRVPGAAMVAPALPQLRLTARPTPALAPATTTTSPTSAAHPLRPPACPPLWFSTCSPLEGVGASCWGEEGDAPAARCDALRRQGLANRASIGFDADHVQALTEAAHSLLGTPERPPLVRWPRRPRSGASTPAAGGDWQLSQQMREVPAWSSDGRGAGGPPFDATSSLTPLTPSMTSVCGMAPAFTYSIAYSSWCCPQILGCSGRTRAP